MSTSSGSEHCASAAEGLDSDGDIALDAGQEAQACDDVAMRKQWRPALRKYMAVFLASRLSSEAIEAMSVPDAEVIPPWPRNFTAHYRTLHCYIKQYFMDRGWAADDIPSYRSTRDAGKKWTRRFLKNGHVNNEPPHKKGYKVERNRPYLEEIVQMVREGYTDDEGNHHLYRDLHHLQSKRPEDFNRVLEQTGLKTVRGLLLQVKQAFPKLKQVSIRLKKQRTDEDVQVWSVLHAVEPGNHACRIGRGAVHCCGLLLGPALLATPPMLTV